MAMFIVARSIQGMGGGILIGTAFACVPELFTDVSTRLRWQMALSGTFSVINAVGPSLGGYLTEHHGWRSIFWLNIPLGSLGIWFVWRYLPFRAPSQLESKRVDWIGASLIAMTLATLQLFVERLWDSPDWKAVLLGATSLVSFLLLCRQESTCINPLIPRALYSDRTLVRLLLVASLTGAVMFTLMFYLPLLLQGGMGLSPKIAGALMTPMGFSVTVGAVLTARFAPRLANPNQLPLMGLSMVLIACFSLAVPATHLPGIPLIASMITAGLGIGFVMLNLTVFTQAIAPAGALGVATALQQSARLVGGMLGAGLTGALIKFQYQEGVHNTLQRLGLDSWLVQLSDPQLLTDERAGIPIQALDIARHELVSAIGTGMQVCTGLAMVAILLLLRVPQVVLHAHSRGTNQMEDVS